MLKCGRRPEARRREGSATDVLLLILATLVPGLLWVVFFYRQDRWEAEPPGLVLWAFILGGAAIVPASLLETPFRDVLAGPADPLAQLIVVFLVVGLGEELAKFAAVYLAVWGSRHFNEIMDGIVYSVAAALGFATVENVVYATAFGLEIAPARAFLTSLAHASFSGVMGFYLGWARLFAAHPGPVLAGGVAAAALLHGAYDYVLLAGWASPALALAMVGGLYGLLSRKIRTASRLSPFRRGRE